MDTEIKVGTILIAKDVCAMYDGTGDALIIRKKYSVTGVDSIKRTITIQSELKEHDFTTESIEDPAHWSHFFAIEPMDTTTPAHTPTPWRVEKADGKFPIYQILVGGPGESNEVCRLHTATMSLKHQQEANAQLIVTAVNSHDSNVKRIQELEAGKVELITLLSDCADICKEEDYPTKAKQIATLIEKLSTK